MKDKANAVDRIVEVACQAIGDLGLAMLTTQIVAERAGVSTALIHYHFDTKARLLVASADRIAARRANRRSRALSAKPGLDALDELWRQLEEGVSEGLERAWLELVLFARNQPAVATALTAPQAGEREAITRRLPSLLRELGAGPPAQSDEIAATLDATLDGLTLALLEGQNPAVVRTAYDAFWLTLIAAAPARRS